MNEIFHQSETQEQRESLEKVQAVFVLSAGHPGEDVHQDSKLNALGVLEMIPALPSLERIYFVGGKSERPDQKNFSEDEMEYFMQKYSQDTEQHLPVCTLAKSNNTVGNIDEIMEEVKERHISQFVIVSNSYHTRRVETILRERGIEARVLGSEDFVRGRSTHHEIYVDKRLRSPEYAKNVLKEGVLTLLLKVDPEYTIVQKWRTFSRSRKKPSS